MYKLSWIRYIWFNQLFGFMKQTFSFSQNEKTVSEWWMIQGDHWSNAFNKHLGYHRDHLIENKWPGISRWGQTKLFLDFFFYFFIFYEFLYYFTFLFVLVYDYRGIDKLKVMITTVHLSLWRVLRRPLYRTVSKWTFGNRKSSGSNKDL